MSRADIAAAGSAITPRRSVRAFLDACEGVVCGMLLGVADLQAIENTRVAERVPVEQFARFLS
jgi:hypothetical protein